MWEVVRTGHPTGARGVPGGGGEALCTHQACCYMTGSSQPAPPSCRVGAAQGCCCCRAAWHQRGQGARPRCFSKREASSSHRTPLNTSNSHPKRPNPAISAYTHPPWQLGHSTQCFLDLSTAVVGRGGTDATAVARHAQGARRRAAPTPPKHMYNGGAAAYILDSTPAPCCQPTAWPAVLRGAPRHPTQFRAFDHHHQMS